MKIYALQITSTNNPYWKVGKWLKFVPAYEQEPALGFGNFDKFDQYTTATAAAFYETKEKAQVLADKFSSRSRARATVVEFGNEL